MKISQIEIEQFLLKEFPQSLEKCVIEEVVPKGATMRCIVNNDDLRPGGTISGPTMMMLADFALYVAILGEIGLVGLTVTTNMNINFLRKPSGGKDIRGQCKLMKVGKTLVVGEVWIYSVDSPDPVAHVVGSYSIPPQRDLGPKVS
ncbi:acyl-coenzyme A thioesterase PaaI-like protein [Acinetobacter calcoaceticus]|uniref:Acyl-coenzyme A thioesterase PaaI-like protein n=1 Tax=Acinetobacter calcoaceticus TaxID=471 RepID=A0A4R1XX00_ACICA|nr:acyl-coenzyme A thioesterase PaaI-like protein [Acinetobacter calcoaceticus]